MPGRVPALEILISTAAVKDYLLDPEKTSAIPDLIEDGGQYGMLSFDQSIMGLYKAGMISFEEAINQCTNPDEFDMRVRGIMGASDRWEGKGKDIKEEQPGDITNF